jgi:hypothetical protein
VGARIRRAEEDALVSLLPEFGREVHRDQELDEIRVTVVEGVFAEQADAGFVDRQGFLSGNRQSDGQEGQAENAPNDGVAGHGVLL